MPSSLFHQCMHKTCDQSMPCYLERTNSNNVLIAKVIAIYCQEMLCVRDDNIEPRDGKSYSFNITSGYENLARGMSYA